jgi:hypothetical protein
MYVEISLVIRIGSQPERGVAMSDWSSDAAKRIQRQQDDERIKAEKELQENKLLELDAPRLWQELRDLLIQMCNEFNSEPGMSNQLKFANKRATDLSIEYPARNRSLSISFDSARRSVMVMGCIAASYKMIVNAAREVSMVDANTLSIATGEIAKKTMTGLLGI